VGAQRGRYGVELAGNIPASVSQGAPMDGGPAPEKEEVMAEAVPLPSPGPRSHDRERHLEVVPASDSDHSHCSLCGRPLDGDARRFSLVSPIGAGEHVTVCSTCHRAALGEGYRPL
jgi:hypothetical protein